MAKNKKKDDSSKKDQSKKAKEQELVLDDAAKAKKSNKKNDKKKSANKKAEKKADKKADAQKDEKKSVKKAEAKKAEAKKLDKKAKKKAHKKSAKKSEARKDAKKADKKKSDKKVEKKSDKKKSSKPKKVKETTQVVPTDQVPEPEIELNPAVTDFEDFTTEEIPQENLFGSADFAEDSTLSASDMELLEDLQQEATIPDSLVENGKIEILDPTPIVDDEEVQEPTEHVADEPSEVLATARSIEGVTKRELYAEAIALNIARRSSMNKEQLFQAVENAKVQ